MKRLILVFLAWLFRLISSEAQYPLEIPLEHRCSFSGKVNEDELFEYPANPKVQNWINVLLQAGGVSQNFTIKEANVQNIAAVYDTATYTRYLLFSQHFIENANTKLEVFGALAHEIGHHVLGHTFQPWNRKAEEMEADEFMGFCLGQVGQIFSVQEAQEIVQILPSPYKKKLTSQERKIAIDAGWQRAEHLVTINGAAFDNDPRRDETLMPQFSFPKCYSPFPLDRNFFYKAKTLEEIDHQLISILNSKGYTNRRYLSVPGGYAMVTQMEQIKPDFTCYSDLSKRWSSSPVCASFSGFIDYFKLLVQAEKAYFRVFVFVVSNQNHSPNDSKRVTREEASAWCKSGPSQLPPYLKATLFSPVHTIEVLVYEFQVPEANRIPQQKCPDVETQLHLIRSGIWGALARY